MGTVAGRNKDAAAKDWIDLMPQQFKPVGNGGRHV